MKTKTFERPPILTTDERERLFVETGSLYVAPHAHFMLGLSGLSALEVVSLDVRHVSRNGVEAVPIIEVPNVDAREVEVGPTRPEQISETTRRALNRYLGWRRNRCLHYRFSMRTEVDAQGAVRCCNCGDLADFLSSPLFDSRQGDRLSVHRLRHEFEEFRDMLELNPALRFDSLRETFIADLIGRGPGKRAA